MSNSFTSMPMVYEKNAFSTPFLFGYKLLKIPIVNASGVPTWPELFPSATIDQMHQTVGHRHFMSQMMLVPVMDRRTPVNQIESGQGGKS